MSLLVFNASNRIAHGVVRKLYNSGNFEKVVCADIYPNYFSVQRFLNFKNELGAGNSNTKLTDVKVSERSDLKDAVAAATHIVYITHDYYTLTASKLNLIKATAEIAKKNKNVKSFVALTPLEHDHYGEENAADVAKASEAEASKAFPEMVHLKTDLTFGPDSTLAHSILTRAINGLGVSYTVPTSGSTHTHPIHTEDIASIVEAALRDDSHQGKSFLLQGPESVSLADYIKTLHAYSGEDVSGPSLLEKVLPPGHKNLLSERLYCQDYINMVRLLAQYKPISQHTSNSAHSFNVPLQHFKNAYPAKGANKHNYVNEDSSLERMVKKFLY